MAYRFAALRQDRDGCAGVRLLAISPLEQAFFRVGVLPGVSASGGRPFQLGVRRDRLASVVTTAARYRPFIGIVIHGGTLSAPDGVRYGLAALAAIAAAIGVQQAMRIPPLKDIEIDIHALPRQFDGYTICN